MLDFSLGDEERQIRDTVRSFIEREVMPLEPEVLRNERAGRPGIDAETLTALRLKARQAGFWGVTTPEEYGGMNLGAIMAGIIPIQTRPPVLPVTLRGTPPHNPYTGKDE